MNSDPKRQELSNILKHLAGELDITPTKRQEATDKYKAVTEWLGDSKGCLVDYHPDIFPHGSFRLGTVVRSLGQDEFDLDFTCRLEIGPSERPEAVKALVGQRLLENGRYENIAKPKNRCWRINYSGDFHMDIMPAIPDARHEFGNIWVPDRKLAAWIRSNPRGYAKWFDDVMIPMRDIVRLEARASVETLPDEKIKTPLQLAIQILKRHRDLRFQHDLDNRPGSIILTTLAAKAYNREADLFSTILTIALGMPDQIERDELGHPVVKNPANLSENLAEKWKEHPERLIKFANWLGAVREDLLSLLAKDGLPGIGQVLESRFGERETRAAFRKHGEYLNDSHTQGKVGFVGGAVVLNAPNIVTPIRRNTSYGG